MRSIIPTQDIKATGELFPVHGDECKKLATAVSMELFGCSVAEVARELECTTDEVFALAESPDYARVKNAMILNVRKLDQNELQGRMLQEADNAFDRMKELAESAEREDVRFNANKDLMDRALIAGSTNMAPDELRITLIKRR